MVSLLTELKTYIKSKKKFLIKQRERIESELSTVNALSKVGSINDNLKKYLIEKGTVIISNAEVNSDFVIDYVSRNLNSKDKDLYKGAFLALIYRDEQLFEAVTGLLTSYGLNIPDKYLESRAKFCDWIKKNSVADFEWNRVRKNINQELSVYNSFIDSCDELISKIRDDGLIKGVENFNYCLLFLLDFCNQKYGAQEFVDIISYFLHYKTKFNDVIYDFSNYFTQDGKFIIPLEEQSQVNLILDRIEEIFSTMLNDDNSIKMSYILEDYPGSSDYEFVKDIMWIFTAKYSVEEPKVQSESTARLKDKNKARNRFFQELKTYYNNGEILRLCENLNEFKQLLVNCELSNQEQQAIYNMMAQAIDVVHNRTSQIDRINLVMTKEEREVYNLGMNYIKSNNIYDARYYTIKAMVDEIQEIIEVLNGFSLEDLTKEAIEYFKSEIYPNIQKMKEYFSVEEEIDSKIHFAYNEDLSCDFLDDFNSLNQSEKRSAISIIEKIKLGTVSGARKLIGNLEYPIYFITSDVCRLYFYRNPVTEEILILRVETYSSNVSDAKVIKYMPNIENLNSKKVITRDMDRDMENYLFGFSKKSKKMMKEKKKNE